MEHAMIRLTRLHNQSLTLNSDLIKFVEQSPDTLITLVSGEKILVRETVEEVVAGVIAFRRAVLQGISCAWDPSSAPSIESAQASRRDRQK